MKKYLILLLFPLVILSCDKEEVLPESRDQEEMVKDSVDSESPSPDNEELPDDEKQPDKEESEGAETPEDPPSDEDQPSEGPEPDNEDPPSDDNSQPEETMVFDGFKTYAIPANGHSSGSFFRMSGEQVIEFQAGFDQSARYSTVDKKNQGDINKLYGVSDCGSHHHTNSARFGWRWYEDELQIFAYTYNQGERISEYITSLELNKSHHFRLELQNNKYIFTVNNFTVEMERGCSENSTNYYLYPYFGGDETAPHEVKVYIRE